MAVSVLIADDQPLMRTALTMSLEAEPDIAVVGQAVDGLDAVEQASALRPDVVVMDIRMPQLDGVEATRRLAAGAHGAASKVLIITTFDLDEYVVAALRAGASGFLLKDATALELVHAVRVIAAGEALLAPRVTKRLLDNFAQRLPMPAASSAAVSAEITRRELAVLLHVARGMSNSEIAAALFLAESSVKTHVGHLLAKLQCHDRVQLVIYAYETGLVTAGSASYQRDSVP